MSKTQNSMETGGRETELRLPEYEYSPKLPQSYRPKIGLIGCGGITRHHLRAYRDAGLNVVALCDLNLEAAKARQEAFFPDAAIYTEAGSILERSDIEVVDIALHLGPRVPLLEQALLAGKHVLSQKPFVEDLEQGRRLVDLARKLNRKLAVNQNGRWAPYVRWIALALRDGLIGDIQGVNMRINWDHTWVKGTAFETMPDLILYDFAVHWIDMTRLFFGNQACRKVEASRAFAPAQEIGVPMMASVLYGFETGNAILDFDGHSRFLSEESIMIRGSRGTIRASGGVCMANHIEVENEAGVAALDLQGTWFPDGFRGAMGELLLAIEQDRLPENDAEDNLKSLELVFAAIGC